MRTMRGSSRERSPFTPQWMCPANKIFMGKGYDSLDIAGQFVDAYRALGDRRYLEVCRRAGGSAIKVQKAVAGGRGGWPAYPVAIQPDGKCIVTWAPDLINIQEGTQTRAAALMATLWYMTGVTRFLDSYRWNCETVLGLQNEFGGWSGMYTISRIRPPATAIPGSMTMPWTAPSARCSVPTKC